MSGTRKILGVRGVSVACLVMLGGCVLGVSVASAKPVRPVIAELNPAGGFDGAMGVAVNQETGDVYVADSPKDVVDVFGGKGGSPSSGVPAQITGFSFNGETAAVAVDNACYYHVPRLADGSNACEEFDPSDGDVYVADAGSGAVEKLKLNTVTHEYEVQQKFPFQEVTGVAVDEQGNVYVADYYNSSIVVLNPAGVEAGRIPQHLVAHPFYVAVGAPGAVYVGGYAQGGVEKLMVNSSYEVQAGGETLLDGSGDAAAVDPAGNVYVDEGHLGEPGGVSEYNAAGEPTGRFPFARAQVGGTQGIALDDESGDMYLANIVYSSYIVLPGVSGCTASAAGGTTATLDGSLEPEGILTSWYFEYGRTTAYGSRTPSQQTSAATVVEEQVPLAGLEPHATYHCRLVGTVEIGGVPYSSEGEDSTFTTNPAPPVIAETSAAPGSTPRTTAFLSGVINAENTATSYQFSYIDQAGREAGYAPVLTAKTSAGAGAVAGPVTPILVEGLTAGTTYHYRLIATNEFDETTTGPEETFTTAPPTPPIVKDAEAAVVTQNTATIDGTIDTQGLVASYELDLGYLQGGQVQYTGAQYYGNVPVGGEAVEVALEGLAAGSTYYYRLTASNEDGTGIPLEGSFTTPPAPVFSLALPASLPLLATPQVVFPTETGTITTTETKKLTNAQKLAAALKVCRKQPKHKQAACEREAHKKYAAPGEKTKGRKKG